MSEIILVELENNQPTTTSLKIAEFFKKDHRKILRDIKKLVESAPSSSANFGLCEYIGGNGQAYPMYKLTKTGFTLLAMGFTGSKAIKFKLDYIQAFEAMEKKLASANKELSTLDILKLATSEIERLSSQLVETQATLDHKQAVIVDLAEKVPAKTMRATINEVVRAFAVREGRMFNYVWKDLYKEFKYLYSVDLETRAKHAKQSKIDIAEEIGQLENLYLLSLKMFEI